MRKKRKIIFLHNLTDKNIYNNLINKHTMSKMTIEIPSKEYKELKIAAIRKENLI